MSALKIQKITKYNSMKFGILLGIILPIITFLLVYLFKDIELSFFDYVKRLIKFDVFTKMLSLSVIPNLLLFYLFLQKNYLYSTRGIIIATIVITVFVLIVKIL